MVHFAVAGTAPVQASRLKPALKTEIGPGCGAWEGGEEGRGRYMCTQPTSSLLFEFLGRAISGWLDSLRRYGCCSRDVCVTNDL